MYKNIIKFGICCGMFLFCFSLTEASDICEFNGFIPEPDKWEEIEFSTLLETEEVPGYPLMKAIIGKIAVTDSSILKSSSCKVSKYVAKLIKFFEENKTVIQNKHKEVADSLDFIKTNLEFD